MTNFDLRGREASITARFIFNPKDETPGDNATFYIFDSLSTNVWIVILAPILVILTLIIVLRLATGGQRRMKKKVSGFAASSSGHRNSAAKVPLKDDQSNVPVNV